MYTEVSTQAMDYYPNLFAIVDMGYPMDDTEWQTQAEIETTSWGENLKTSQSFMFESMPFGPVSLGVFENGNEYKYRITAPLTHKHVGMLLGIDSSSQRVWEGPLTVARSIIASQHEKQYWNPFLKSFRLPSKEEVTNHWPDCWLNESENNLYVKKLQIVIRF